MIIYISIFIFLTLLGLSIPDRSSKIYLVFVSIFLIWFMGARYQVGCDFSGYFHRFLITPTDLTISALIERFEEPGFWILNYLLRKNDISYMWLNIISSAVMVICFYIFCRAHKNSGVLLALLFPIIIVQLGMSGIRQGIATAFLMVGSVAWIRNSRLWTAIWIMVGAQFHASVIMFLPLALLAGKRVSTLRLATGLAIATPVTVFLLGDRLGTYTDRYVGTDITSGGALIRYTLILLPAILFLQYRKKLLVTFPQPYELMKLFTLITFAMLPIAVFSSILLHRVNYYVMPFSILTFSYVSLIAFRSMDRTAARAIPALAYGTYSVLWFLTSRHADSCYTPYQNFTFI